MQLIPFSTTRLPELMGWFPDAASCRLWGGPEFRHPFTPASFREDAKVDSLPSRALLADDGSLAAFGQYYLRLGRCHLGRLAVAPALRGRGIGGRLVRELARHGTRELGVDGLSLFVLPGNERALALYRRLGFSAMPYPEPAPAFDGCIYMVATAPGLGGARQIRDAVPDDFPRILALNEASVRYLSPLDGERLAGLHEQAAYHRVLEVDGRVAAFLLAFREGARYDSPNYRWFAERYRRFLYIDRVVVAGARQGQGLGRRLYADLLAFARNSDAEHVTCEFDIEPPNEPSRRFHAAFGFREVGTRVVSPGGKRVSLQALPAGPENGG